MKIVCINNWYNNENDICYNLTLCKTYKVINKDIYQYNIIDDFNNRCWYNKDRFKLLSEYRNDRIDKLLEDENNMY
jgi:hypothetical protein